MRVSTRNRFGLAVAAPMLTSSGSVTTAGAARGGTLAGKTTARTVASASSSTAHEPWGLATPLR